MSGIAITIQRYESAQEKSEENERNAQCRKRRKEDDSWLRIIPSQRVKIKQCDELSDEFKRAGIGLCFEGRVKTVFTLVQNSFIYIDTADLKHR